MIDSVVRSGYIFVKRKEVVMSTLTSKEAARSLGVTVRSIQIHCQKLGVQKLGRDYLITPKALTELRKHVQVGPGRPKIK